MTTMSRLFALATFATTVLSSSIPPDWSFPDLSEEWEWDTAGSLDQAQGSQEAQVDFYVPDSSIILLADFEYVEESEALLMETLLLDAMDETEYNLIVISNVTELWGTWLEQNILQTTVIVPPLTWSIMLDPNKKSQFAEKITVIKNAYDMEIINNTNSLYGDDNVEYPMVFVKRATNKEMVQDVIDISAQLWCMQMSQDKPFCSMIDHPSDCVSFVMKQARMSLFYDLTLDNNTNDEPLSTKIILDIFETTLKDENILYDKFDSIENGINDFTTEYSHDIFVYFQDSAEIAINETDLEEARQLEFDFEQFSLCKKLIVWCASDEKDQYLRQLLKQQTNKDSFLDCEFEIVRVWSLQQVSVIVDKFRSYQHRAQLRLFSNVQTPQPWESDDDWNDMFSSTQEPFSTSEASYSSYESTQENEDIAMSDIHLLFDQIKQNLNQLNDLQLPQTTTENQLLLNALFDYGYDDADNNIDNNENESNNELTNDMGLTSSTSTTTMKPQAVVNQPKQTIEPATIISGVSINKSNQPMFSNEQTNGLSLKTTNQNNLNNNESNFPIGIVSTLCGFAFILMVVFVVTLYLRMKEERTKTHDFLNDQINFQNESETSESVATQNQESNTLDQVILHQSHVR